MGLQKGGFGQETRRSTYETTVSPAVKSLAQSLLERNLPSGEVQGLIKRRTLSKEGRD